VNRPLRVGDRVTATGTVTYVGVFIHVDLDGDARFSRSAVTDPATWTLIEPAEPPVGSVVVKDGTAWIRWNTGIGAHWRNEHGDQDLWVNLSDGEVIFTPGGGA
jgi:hypothetical protein